MNWQKIGIGAGVVVLVAGAIVALYFILRESPEAVDKRQAAAVEVRERNALDAEAEYRLASARYLFARGRYEATRPADRRKLEDELLQTYAAMSRAFAKVAYHRGVKSVGPGQTTNPNLPELPGMPSMPRSDEIPGLNPAASTNSNLPSTAPRGTLRFPPAQ